MPLPRDANGWNIYTPSGTPQNGFNTGAPSSTTTMVIYVSSSTGKDSGDGGFNSAIQGSTTQPYRTIASGLARIRSGSPDWLLLKIGDDFLDQTLSGFNRSGRNANERAVISSYDPSLPFTPNPGAAYGAQPRVMPSYNVGGFDITTSNDFIAVEGIDFYAYTTAPLDTNFIAKPQIVTFIAGSPGKVVFPTGTFQSNKIGQPGVDSCVFVATSGTLPSPLVDGMTRGGSGLLFETGYNLTSTATPDQYTIGVNLASAGSGTYTAYLGFNRAIGLTIPDTSTATAISIDDCRFRFFDNGPTMTMKAAGADLSVRRNRIVSCWAQGADTAVRMEFLENFVDACGWQVDYPYNAWERTKDQLLHNLYISLVHTDPSYLRVAPMQGNIISRDTGGSQLRTGGIMIDNFVYDNPAACISWAMLDGATDHRYGLNVMYECQNWINIDTPYAGDPGGNYQNGHCLVDLNITTSPASAHNGDTSFTTTSDLSTALYTFRSNVSWGRNLSIQNNGTPSGNTIIEASNLESPLVSGSHVNNHSYLDPGRTMASYMNSIYGGSSHVDQDFIDAAALQRKGNWDTRLTANAINNYFRVGFNMATFGGGVTPPPVLMPQICL